MKKYFFAVCCCFIGKLAFAQPEIPRYVAPLNEVKEMMKKADEVKAISPDLFEAHTYNAADGKNLGYRLLKPVVSAKKYPLVIVFHGSGAVGTDNRSQVGVLSKMWTIDSIRQQYPAYVLVPQFPERSSNYVMDKKRGVLTSSPQPYVFTLLQLVDSIKRTMNIDTNRIYVIGFSMGGSTTLNAISLRPDLFAAGVSFSGIPNFDGIKTFVKTPLWIVHGSADDENPFASDSLLYKEMKTRGAKKIEFWNMHLMEHKIPEQFYTGALLPEWLFRHRKK